MQLWSSYLISLLSLSVVGWFVWNAPFSIPCNRSNVNTWTPPKMTVKVKSCARTSEWHSCVSFAWKHVQVYMCWPHQITEWRNNSSGATNRRPAGQMRLLRTAVLRYYYNQTLLLAVKRSVCDPGKSSREPSLYRMCVFEVSKTQRGDAACWHAGLY